MNDYMIAFMKMGEQRDSAMMAIAGLVLAFVAAYGAVDLYYHLKFINIWWRNSSRSVLIGAVLAVYVCSWFVKF